MESGPYLFSKGVLQISKSPGFHVSERERHEMRGSKREASIPRVIEGDRG